MDILEKITKLRESRKRAKYMLSEKSSLAQPTISSWYKKNMLHPITSL